METTTAEESATEASESQQDVEMQEAEAVAETVASTGSNATAPPVQSGTATAVTATGKASGRCYW